MSKTVSKMGLVEIIPGIGGKEIKENGIGDAFNNGVFDILLELL
jgi:hypothetical protein